MVVRRWVWWAALAWLAAAWAGCDRPSSRTAQSSFAARPEALDFGPAALGRTKSMKLRVANAGRASFRVEGASASVPNVAVAPFEGFTLEAGGERELDILFTPQVEGPMQGVVEVLTDADEEGVARVNVTGVGVKAWVEVNGQSLDFGNVPLENVAIRELTLRNPGTVDSPLHFEFTGPDADQFSSGVGQDAVLRPGESLALPVAYKPVRLGAAEASLRVAVCEGCEPAVVALTGAGIASLLEVSPLRLDFGRVALGATAEQAITVRNQGTEPMQYTGASIIEDPSGVFRVASAPVLAGNTLAAGGSVEIRVAFTPSAQGRVREGRVEVGVRAMGNTGPGPKVSLVGEGGSACVVVLPRTLDFGAVAEGMAATREVEVSNRCREDAQVTALRVDTQQGGFFSLAQAPASIPVPAGGKARVGLTFTPRAGAGASRATLTVTSRFGSSSSTESVQLLGTGRAFQPCQYQLVPPALDFGRVPVGAEVTLGLVLRNAGSEACYLAAMQLVGGSDAAFSATPVGNSVLSPGQKATLLVKFKPTGESTYGGLAEAWVNHPTAGHPTVEVRGQGVRGCFAVQPTTVDFGVAKLTCGARTKELVAFNSCPAPITVKGFTLEQVGTEFEVPVPAGAPWTLVGGGQLRLTARYTPVDDGDDAATLRFELPDGARYTTGLVGRGVTKAEQTDRFIQQSEAKVDVLFVVDNSGSMMEEQQSLGQNFQAFMSTAVAASVDYHIGVTTTGIEPSPGGWSVCPGGTEGGEAGRLFPANSSSPRVITPTTPNPAGVFANNTRVGVCHWNEQGLEASYRALSDPLLNNADDPSTPLANDGNGGFLRDEAKLAIIYLSDEEDFSSRAVDFYKTHFLALKGNDASKLSISAIVGPSNLATCPTASSAGNRYIQLAQATGGVVESICTPNWADALRNLSSSAFGPNRTFKLSEKPDPPDGSKIVVRVDGVLVTVGWHYDPATNAVIFDQGAAPPPGSVVEITYPLGCD
ncbi:choice-of-anchor D domain-containing protein [Myxococcaceae bacterium GXIMD 01537]